MYFEKRLTEKRRDGIMELTPFEQKLIEALRDPEKGPQLYELIEVTSSDERERSRAG